MGASCSNKLAHRNQQSLKPLIKTNETLEVDTAKVIEKIVKKARERRNKKKAASLCHQILQCLNCKGKYSDVNFAVLLECHHSVCLRCFNLMKADTSACPFDGNSISFDRPIKNDKIMEELNETQERSTKFLIPHCDSNHELEWVPGKSKCYVHQEEAVCLGCPKDSFYLCISKCLSGRMKFSSKKCIFNHKLKWHSGVTHCARCRKESFFGTKCLSCKDYYQCLECSNFKFTTNVCPNDHELELNDERLVVCYKCHKSNDSCLSCEDCDYYICLSCKDNQLTQSVPNKLNNRFGEYSFTKYKLTLS